MRKVYSDVIDARRSVEEEKKLLNGKRIKGDDKSNKTNIFSEIGKKCGISGDTAKSYFYEYADMLSPKK